MRLFEYEELSRFLAVIHVQHITSDDWREWRLLRRRALEESPQGADDPFAGLRAKALEAFFELMNARNASMFAISVWRDEPGESIRVDMHDNAGQRLAKPPEDLRDFRGGYVMTEDNGQGICRLCEDLAVVVCSAGRFCLHHLLFDLDGLASPG